MSSVSEITASAAEEVVGQPPRRRWLPGGTKQARFNWLLLALPVLYMLVMYVYPVSQMLLRSITDPDLSLENFRTLFTNSGYRRVLFTTIRISFYVVVLTLLLGYPVAYLLSTLPARTARWLAFLVLLPFWTSVLVRSFAWIVILGDNGLLNAWFAPLNSDKPFHLLFTEKAVVIGMVHVLLPFMILTLTATMAQIDHSLVLAAQTLGASPARAFLKVYLPLSMPGVASGSMLVFIMGLGYYITPALLGGPRQIMFANLIDRFVNQTFQWGVAAAAAVLLLVISTVLYVVSRRFGRVEGLFGG
ncbi:MAG TPA: ABC transporter permease [Thermomicrobiales bacterium]|nr:ABC transporter permease [Thermomicrobiales bacterium]